MKANEGKIFAFIRANKRLSILYTNYEGKLNFKDQSGGSKRDGSEMICSFG